MSIAFDSSSIERLSRLASKWLLIVFPVRTSTAASGLAIVKSTDSGAAAKRATRSGLELASTLGRISPNNNNRNVTQTVLKTKVHVGVEKTNIISTIRAEMIVMQILTKLFTIRIVANNRSLCVSNRMIVSEDGVRLSFISRICCEVSEKNAVSDPETNAETHNNRANTTAIAITDEGSNCPKAIIDKYVVVKSLRFG